MRIKVIIFDLDDTLYDTHAQTVKPANLLPGTIQALVKFKTEFKLFLVTIGDLVIQKRKVEQFKLGSYFEQIFYVDRKTETSKRLAFESILNISNTAPAEIVSIGNRVDTDIRWAKELGMKGVLFEYGEYQQLVPQVLTENPDARVKNLGEFKKWLEQNGRE